MPQSSLTLIKSSSPKRPGNIEFVGQDSWSKSDWVKRVGVEIWKLPRVKGNKWLKRL